MLRQLPNDDQHRSLFQITKLIRNRHQQMPPLKNGENILITPEEKANALAAQFAENHQNPLATDNRSHTVFVERSVQRFLCRSEISNDSIELSNTLEVRELCKKLRNRKAPGPDNISNTLIKRLPPLGILYLTIIINSCLKLQYFPQTWKHANVIPISKPGKPTSLTSSYRPISLLSSLNKIFERIILR